MVRKRLQPGSTMGRKVVRPPRPPKGKSRDAMSKILMAPKQSGPPRTKPKFSKGIGSLMSEGMSKGMATNAMKKAAMELGKGKKGKPSNLKRSPKMTKENLEKIKRLLKDKLGNKKKVIPSPLGPKRNRARFMKK